MKHRLSVGLATTHVAEVGAELHKSIAVFADRSGSVVAVVDTAGTVTDKYITTPFGVEAPLDASGNPFRYTGRKLDPETGLYYYRARYYDPDQGRFLETDPVFYEDQMNLYAYVGNDPVNMTDPSGMIAVRDIVRVLTRVLKPKPKQDGGKGHNNPAPEPSPGIVAVPAAISEPNGDFSCNVVPSGQIGGSSFSRSQFCIESTDWHTNSDD